MLGRYGNPLTWEILNFLRKLFDEGLLGFSREFSLFTVFLHAFLFDLKLLSCNYQPLFHCLENEELFFDECDFQAFFVRNFNNLLRIQGLRKIPLRKKSSRTFLLPYPYLGSV
ncbi:CFA_G0000810.mRNA.1.CDS.1 [Saccharomyces cerevisiae]|nr:CFA_G0000810.mRNA.1.CDS.1 [Saccharomyces cerevisiae]CAI7128997.1 CFA_G0000810.mRNA.1.CDS.1 [Saccharomyces cerevisiae]